MAEVKSSDIYDAGFALPSYDICNDIRRWRYRNEEYVLPMHAVPLVDFPGVEFQVARIEDVRRSWLMHPTA